MAVTKTKSTQAEINRKEGRSVLNTPCRATALAQECSSKVEDECIEFSGCTKHGIEYRFADGSVLYIKMGIGAPCPSEAKATATVGGTEDENLKVL